MYKILSLIVTLFLFTSHISAQKMSDEQVVQYIIRARENGKTEMQMTYELARRGVTSSQIDRIKNRLEANQGTPKQAYGQSRNRAETRVTAGTLDEISVEIEDPTTVRSAAKAARMVYGRNIFSSRNLSFEPYANIATPLNYVLGPGDEVIIDIWGVSQKTIREVISPEGNIMVDKIGPVYLNGMSIAEANEHVKGVFSKTHAAIAGQDAEIKLSLGDSRSIQVNVMGEVVVPGTYTLSAFSSVFHALYYAGGVSQIGSLRNVQVIRGSRKIADLDVYEYILEGKTSDDIRLMEGDIILIPPYECLVDISGKVKRPMFYEMKKDETLADLITYAGGFASDSYTDNIRLFRQFGREKQIYTIDQDDFEMFRIFDGDAFTVGAILNRFENKAEIRGPVNRKGLYQINEETKTLKDLIEQADGLRGEVFMNRAHLYREREDLSIELISVDLNKVMTDQSDNLMLCNNDILRIYNIHEIQQEGVVSIYGQIARPGNYSFMETTTIEDIIVKAGGLLEAASYAKIDVARRIKDPRSLDAPSELTIMYSLELEDGELRGDYNQFYLEPFDMIYVRRSPNYYKQTNVAIRGEVVFDGTYALIKKNERLSDLIERAGGVTQDAYVKGARLVRYMNEEERKQKRDVIRLADRGLGKDSISFADLDMGERYMVGIDLEKALDSPGSEYDMVLREGDVLIIPEYINTVKVNGAVMYPNTVLYEKGAGLRHYVDQAGGYGYLAKKKKAYVIYLNGTVSKFKRSSHKTIEPGCEIIIPSKEPKGAGMEMAEFLRMSTSLTTLTALMATTIRLSKDAK